AVLADHRRWLDEVRGFGDMMLAAGRLTSSGHEAYVDELERGREVGVERGRTQARRSRAIPDADPSAFRPYPEPPAGGRLHVCFISHESPPGDFGGIGRFTRDLAVGFAHEGHEVHVVTEATDRAAVSWEDGVWMHRLAANPRPALARSAVGPTIANAVS